MSESPGTLAEGTVGLAIEGGGVEHAVAEGFHPSDPVDVVGAYIFELRGGLEEAGCLAKGSPGGIGAVVAGDHGGVEVDGCLGIARAGSDVADVDGIAVPPGGWFGWVGCVGFWQKE